MPEDTLVSVVIPVWRDEEALAAALRSLGSPSGIQIVVAGALGDEPRGAGSRDAHPGVDRVSAPRGRAAQMNAGAARARGRWLLFLHADTRLPADWLRVIVEADTRRDIVGGSFRLTFDSGDWQARVLEYGVRLRVALLGLPYGDQALFVRRSTFDTLGGYRDLPLMEDVDLVRRVRRAGRLWHSRSAVCTSARRWERDGWFRRSAHNLTLATRFMLGASPARMAQRYLGRSAGAVVVMARAPWIGGKSRLHAAATDAAAHQELRHALFLDTLDAAMAMPGVEHIIACEPAEACHRMRGIVGPAVDVIAQRGNDLGERLRFVFEDVFRLGVESAVVVGSDLPDLPARLLRQACAALAAGDDRVVLGPATDGGYYLIGLNRSHPALFDRIDWSTDRVLGQTVEAARSEGITVSLLDPWSDVDTDSDLGRVVRNSGDAVATRTRAWGMAHGTRA